MAKATIESDADILEHLIFSGDGPLDVEGARAILKFKFDKAATKEIRLLLQKNNGGKISSPERIKLEKYLRIGKLMNVMQAKARLYLKDAGVSS